MTTGRLAMLALAVAVALTATGAPARSGEAGEVFRVRADPRLCPSPLCGGFFVHRVNGPSTACADGTARAWCYVARINLAALPRPFVPASRPRSSTEASSCAVG